MKQPTQRNGKTEGRDNPAKPKRFTTASKEIGSIELTGDEMKDLFGSGPVEVVPNSAVKLRDSLNLSN